MCFLSYFPQSEKSVCWSSEIYEISSYKYLHIKYKVNVLWPLKLNISNSFKSSKFILMRRKIIYKTPSRAENTQFSDSLTTRPYHLSLLGGISRLHPVSTRSGCMQVHAIRLTVTIPVVGIHWRMLLKSLSLLPYQSNLHGLWGGR